MDISEPMRNWRNKAVGALTSVNWRMQITMISGANALMTSSSFSLSNCSIPPQKNLSRVLYSRVLQGSQQAVSSTPTAENGRPSSSASLWRSLIEKSPIMRVRMPFAPFGKFPWTTLEEMTRLPSLPLEHYFSNPVVRNFLDKAGEWRWYFIRNNNILPVSI